MSNLKELRANMPKDFVEGFNQYATLYGMTSKQLAAYCISMGFKIFLKGTELNPLPSEPSPSMAANSGEDCGCQ